MKIRAIDVWATAAILAVAVSWNWLTRFLDLRIERKRWAIESDFEEGDL